MGELHEIASFFLSMSSSSVHSSPPVSIIVTVDIKPECVPEFIRAIEIDAVGSRQEEGCLRFDVIQLEPAKFIFIEVYLDENAITIHRNMPHFKAWTDFKLTGAVEKQTSVRGTGLFFPPRSNM